MMERRENLLRHRSRFGWITNGLNIAALKLESDYSNSETARTIDGIPVMVRKDFTFVGEDDLHHAILIFHDDPWETYRVELRRYRILRLDFYSLNIDSFTPETIDSFELLVSETTPETIEKMAIDFVNSESPQ